METEFIFVLIIIAMAMWFVLKLVEMSKRPSHRGNPNDPEMHELLSRLLDRAEDLSKRVQNLEEIVKR